MNDSTGIPGYDYGAAAKSPVTTDELAKLKAASLTEEDRRYLTLAGEVLGDEAENLVEAWRARIGAQEHLAKWFYGPDGKPDDDLQGGGKTVLRAMGDRHVLAPLLGQGRAAHRLSLEPPYTKEWLW